MDGHLYNSLTEGDFANGLPLRQSLAEGEFWVLPGGCWAVYRGRDAAANIDYNRIVTAAYEAGLHTVAGPGGSAAGRDTFYACRRISSTGKQERNRRAVVLLSLDDQAKRRAPRPNDVRQLRARQISGGRIRLSWWNWPGPPQAPTDRFVIYGDGGSGLMDYANPLGQVPCDGRYAYAYLSGPGEQGTRYQFGVRADTKDGLDDGNTAVVGVTVDLTGPAPVSDVQWKVGL
ncbi:MAG: hypothetical protein JW810_03795 [Sedimentisphaerales bacterium]|nr:hypothetical protein [Sedimentisphaerales bacterium]